MTDPMGLVGRLENGSDRFLKWAYKEPYSGAPVISIPRHPDNIDALLTEAAACIRKIVEWRPIETAPRDGTVIHVYAPGFDWPEAVLWEFYDPDDAEEASEDGYWTYAESLMAHVMDSCEPELWTHWRPIPLPPAQGAEA